MDCPGSTRWPHCAAVVVSLLLLCAGGVQAQQSADDILAAVRDHYDQQFETVKNYTVVQQIDGDSQVVYYERRKQGGHNAFVPVGPYTMLMESGTLPGFGPGGVVGALRSRMEESAEAAGLAQLRQQIQGMGNGVFADFIGPLLTPEPGATPGGDPPSLTSTEHLKKALVAGARKAALQEVEQLVLAAAAPQMAQLLQGLQSGGAKEILSRLTDQISKGQLPTPGSMFGGSRGPVAGPGVASPSNGLMGAAGMAVGMVAMAKLSDMGRKAVESTASLDLGPDQLFDKLQGHVELDGTEAVDGHDSWVLKGSDASGLGDVASDNFRKPKLTLWVDRQLDVPRRLHIEGEAKMNGKWQPVVLETRHSQYHEVDGLVVPYRSSMSISGPSQAISDKDRKKMQKKMAEMQKQLARMPPQQRAMAEQMLKSRMPQLQAMMDESKPVETVVTDVQVNQGPPAELVQQAKAMTGHGS